MAAKGSITIAPKVAPECSPDHRGERALSLPRFVRNFVDDDGLTLIELVVVIMIIAVMMTLVTVNMGTFAYWREQAFIRQLSELIEFLHQQSVVDQAFYRLEFDPQERVYRVGVVRPDNSDLCSDPPPDAGVLTVELTEIRSPCLAAESTLIPPPSFPSLAEPIPFPEGVSFEDMYTMRGKIRAEDGLIPYTLFSPRGFSEFAVIHLRLTNDADDSGGAGRPYTILINPFTGLTEGYPEYREFEWTYGREKGSS